jgi:hypothetical protein
VLSSSEHSGADFSRWVIVLALGMSLLWGSVFLAEAEYRWAAVLAGANVFLTALIAYGIWRWRGMESAPILVFLPGVAISWPVTTLYFAAFLPQGGYYDAYRETRYLEACLELQVTVLVFVMGFAAGALWVGRSPKAPDRFTRGASPAVEWGLILLALFSATLGWIYNVAGGGKAVSLVANGCRNYFTPLTFIAGYRWMNLSFRKRGLVLGFLLFSAAVNTLGNARSQALWPLILLAFGYLLAPDVSRRKKQLFLGLGLALLPLYLVLGNQTRKSMHRGGFDALGSRAEILGDALRTGDLAYEHEGPLSDLMGRMFSAGGHTLIRENWEHPERLEFDAVDFTAELIRSLAPGFLEGRQVEGQYTGSAILRNYGFLINEVTSVEVSLIGSLFTYFGLPSVLVGGLIFGLFLSLLCRVFGSSGWSATWRLAFLAGTCSMSAWGYNVDIITNIRGIVWALLYLLVVLVAIQGIHATLGLLQNRHSQKGLLHLSKRGVARQSTSQ